MTHISKISLLAIACLALAATQVACGDDTEDAGAGGDAGGSGGDGGTGGGDGGGGAGGDTEVLASFDLVVQPTILAQAYHGSMGAPAVPSREGLTVDLFPAAIAITGTFDTAQPRGSATTNAQGVAAFEDVNVANIGPGLVARVRGSGWVESIQGICASPEGCQALGDVVDGFPLLAQTEATNTVLEAQTGQDLLTASKGYAILYVIDPTQTPPTVAGATIAGAPASDLIYLATDFGVNDTDETSALGAVLYTGAAPLVGALSAEKDGTTIDSGVSAGTSPNRVFQAIFQP